MIQINRHRDTVQDQDRQMMEQRQQVIVLEGQLEQTQETNERLESSLDTYKQKYDACMEEIGHLENKFSQLQEQLSDTRNRVRKLWTECYYCFDLHTLLLVKSFT